MGSCLREAWDRAYERCYQWFPCLSDPEFSGRRSSLGLKVGLVILHLIYGGVVFLLDTHLIEKTRKEPWYTAIYLLLFVATLAQFFFTSGSTPGYVAGAMRIANETQAIFKLPSTISQQSTTSKNGSLIISVEGNQPGRIVQGSNHTSWSKLVMDMYPPGSSISLLEQSIAMIVTNVYFSSIITAPGLEHALVRVIIVDFGGTS